MILEKPAHAFGYARGLPKHPTPKEVRESMGTDDYRDYPEGMFGAELPAPGLPEPKRYDEGVPPPTRIITAHTFS
jgi:hypothetical protein